MKCSAVFCDVHVETQLFQIVICESMNSVNLETVNMSSCKLMLRVLAMLNKDEDG